MIPFFFDLETIWPQEAAIQEHLQEELTPPANYKKPEAIAKWLEENATTKLHSTATDPLYAEIISFAWAFGASDVKVLVRNLHETEENFLTRCLGHIWQMWNHIHQANTPRTNRPVPGVRYVGHNVLWDLRVLRARCNLWGKTWPFTLPERWVTWERSIFDTMAEFDPAKMHSLDQMAYVFFGEHKEVQSIEDMWAAWLARDYDTVATRNRQDVVLARKLYMRLGGPES